MDTSTERSLLERAQMGDERAFDRLVDSCWDGLFKICQRILCDYDLAQHTAYSAVEKAFWKIDTCRERFRPWLYAIGRNLARDIAKSAEHQRTVPLPEPDLQGPRSDSKETFEDQIIMQVDLHGLIDKLDPQYQLVLELRYYDDLEFNDVAEILGINPAAARKLHERAVRALRGMIVRGNIT